MSSTRRNPKPFSLSAGHVALDFVNTLDNRFHPAGTAELLASYADLSRFLLQSGLMKGRAVREPAPAQERLCKAALQSAIKLRESAALVFYAAIGSGPAPGADRATGAKALADLKGFFLDAAAHQELCWIEPDDQGSRVKWTFNAAETDPRLPLWMLARECESLLTSESMARVRACDSATCRWLFLDTSKNQRRRWCDMKVCGNR